MLKATYETKRGNEERVRILNAEGERDRDREALYALYILLIDEGVPELLDEYSRPAFESARASFLALSPVVFPNGEGNRYGDYREDGPSGYKVVVIEAERFLLLTLFAILREELPSASRYYRFGFFDTDYTNPEERFVYTDEEGDFSEDFNFSLFVYYAGTLGAGNPNPFRDFISLDEKRELYP